MPWSGPARREANKRQACVVSGPKASRLIRTTSSRSRLFELAGAEVLLVGEIESFLVLVMFVLVALRVFLAAWLMSCLSGVLVVGVCRFEIICICVRLFRAAN